MQIKDAAIKAFNHVGNSPHTAQQLWSVIDNNDWFSSTAENPSNSLHGVLSESEEFERNGQLPNSKRGRDPYLWQLVDETITADLEYEVPDNFVTSITTAEFDWRELRILEQEDGTYDYEFVDPFKYVYLIPDGENKLVKIGETGQDSPLKRLGNIQTGRPKAWLAVAIPFSRYTEDDLHNKFSELRWDHKWDDPDDFDWHPNREWFHNTKHIKRFIENERNRIENVIDWYNLRRKNESIEIDTLGEVEVPEFA